MAIPTRNRTYNTNENTKIKFDNMATYSEEEISSANIATQMIETFLNSNKKNRIDEINCISSQVLVTAPHWYFDKYTQLVMDLSQDIRNRLSTTDKASLISSLSNNPTDTELREDAYYAISHEFLEFDRNTLKPEYRKLTDTEKTVLLALVYNEICGLGTLEPLYRDTTIREIICNGPFDIQIEVGGILKKVPACKFVSQDHLQDLINRLYSSVNKSVSRMNPYERARLHDNSRIFAVHTAVAPEGPNLNIRRHTEDWISPDSLVDWGAASSDVMLWLGQHINSGLSFVVNGGTSTGKTTMLASLCGFLPNDKRIITIEKNIEIKMPKNKLLAAAMECIPKKNNSQNFEITMRDLVECTTQMRPDIIIAGEVVSDETYDLVQAGNTGHQVASTLHSNSAQDCIYRMMSLISQADLIKGKDAYELIATSVDFIVSLTRFPQDGSRKITEIAEVGTECILGENNVLYLPVKPIWKFVPDKISNELGAKVTGKWEKVGELSPERRSHYNLDLITMKTAPELQKLYK